MWLARCQPTQEAIERDEDNPTEGARQRVIQAIGHTGDG
jgi:hypothetical protein